MAWCLCYFSQQTSKEKYKGETIFKDDSFASLGKSSAGKCQEWKTCCNYLCAHLLDVSESGKDEKNQELNITFVFGYILVAHTEVSVLWLLQAAASELQQNSHRANFAQWEFHG